VYSTPLESAAISLNDFSNPLCEYQVHFQVVLYQP